MLITEEDAKTKWCPDARAPLATIEGRHTGVWGIVVGNRGEALNRETMDPLAIAEGAKCLGSGCMAWRWNRPSPEVVNEARNLGFEPVLLRQGYCGRAGKP